MAKLKLKNLSNIGDVLTSEELKLIYGGTGSGSGKECICYYTLWKGTTEASAGSEVIEVANSQSMCTSMCTPLCFTSSRSDCRGEYK